jgi:hypothetical protein
MISVLLAAILPALAAGDADVSGAVKLEVPRVEYHFNEASATTTPWIDANGWRILRKPDASYYYDVPGAAAELAAAEAFAYGAHARIRTDTAGTEAFNKMLQFLHGIPSPDLPAAANVGILDDGSDETGEVMNLMSRHNLLYRIVSAPDPKFDLNVRLGSPDYPKSEAEDPAFLAQKIRAQLGDDKRLLRVYGSEVVIARLLADGDHARVHLLNFSRRHVLGLRVRVLGEYTRQKLFAPGNADPALTDVAVKDGATEVTLPEMRTYAIIDLSR